MKYKIRAKSYTKISGQQFSVLQERHEIRTKRLSEIFIRIVYHTGMEVVDNKYLSLLCFNINSSYV